MKRLVLSCAFLLTAVTAFPVTFNITLDGVRDAGGNYVPTSTLALIVVDTTGDGFGSNVFAGTSSAVGATFGAADDLIVWRGDFSAGGAGAFSDAVNFTMATITVPANRAIQFVWLPTLTASSLNFTGQAAYGTYSSTDATQFGSTATWSTGASNTAIFTLTAVATGHTDLLFSPDVFANDPAFQSLLPDSALTANASVVPEPATFAGMFGVLSLGVAAIMRRRRSHV